MTRSCVSATTALAILLSTLPTFGQARLMGAGVGVGTGFERTDALQDRLFRRARTRIVVPIDMRIDEDSSEGFGIVGSFEVEPKVSLGGELRYIRWIGSNFSGFVGVDAVLAPRTLLGVGVGCDVVIPFGKSGFGLFVEPSLAAFPLGSDLPDDTVLLWGLISVGVHARF